MKILITDLHAGCQMWQAALLKELGHEVTIDSSSGHAHLIPESWKRKVIIRENGIITNGRALVREFDTVITSFPPNFMNEFKDIVFRRKKLLNLGHRIHIHPARGELVTDGICLASMSTYDAEYFKHYTGKAVIDLQVACFHLPRGLSYSPTQNIVLISPVHAEVLLPFESLHEMNVLCKKFKCNFLFGKARELYGNFRYEHLVNHPACVLFPYSAFSISMVEMYELNIPMFVPSPQLLASVSGPKKLMNDVALYPCYMNETEMKTRDVPHPDSPHKHSPNSYKHEDILYWSQFTYFNTRKNVVYWDSPNDLIHKLITTNLHDVSNRMRLENEEHRIKQLKAWKECISSL
jgi:hypothetical protein